MISFETIKKIFIGVGTLICIINIISISFLSDLDIGSKIKNIAFVLILFLIIWFILYKVIAFIYKKYEIRKKY
ncbi:hypothetical protein [Bacillus wiedmannii]|uniref:hypothetical protein n=1 Tax=Bacillus wiedmannii TaxID=1890302 RepID=UPI000BEFE775|nr:hypothetical protein [Bacillus wiedmannii]PEM27724.1 hypothetical protein CN598_19460 [Bacillus wiedmannii]